MVVCKEFKNSPECFYGETDDRTYNGKKLAGKPCIHSTPHTPDECHVGCGNCVDIFIYYMEEAICTK